MQVAVKEEPSADPGVEAPKKEEEPKIVIRDVTPEGAQATIEKLKFEQSFTLDYADDKEGKTYHGSFTVKRLTIGDVGRRGVEKARLNGSENVDVFTDQLHHMVAHLVVALVKQPDWFDPLNMYDGAILRAVYDKAVAFHNSFRR